jgi:hypothetical protein
MPFTKRLWLQKGLLRMHSIVPSTYEKVTVRSCAQLIESTDFALVASAVPQPRSHETDTDGLAPRPRSGGGSSGGVCRTRRVSNASGAIRRCSRATGIGSNCDAEVVRRSTSSSGVSARTAACTPRQGGPQQGPCPKEICAVDGFDDSTPNSPNSELLTSLGHDKAAPGCSAAMVL